ncbi:MAG: dipeptidase PepE [Gemmataceae bacterium]|nr:dipeptidase PepE [Gemmataceae bacterium]
MRVLLGSGGFRTPERLAFLRQKMRAHFGGIRQLLFVPYALRDHDAYVAMMKERGLDAEYDLVGLHTLPDPVEAVMRAEGVFVGGGNTFRLLGELYGRGLLGVLASRARNGLPYLGVSAGCNVACPTIKTTNDMPITLPPSLDALGLVPFQVNAHYFTGHHFVKEGESLVEHFGETRDERLREFHEMNATPVVGLYEGGTLDCAGGKVLLEGSRARVFRRGTEPVDAEAGTDLAPLLAARPVAYTVTVTIGDPAPEAEWLAWMRGKHLADVRAAGADAAELVGLEGRRWEARYRFSSREAFAAYERDHAPRLRAEGLARFPAERGFAYARTLGDIG